MKTIKSLVLGSAAGLLAMGGAQAADLPVKAKAVEYVRICSLYGAGFFYIPGTDTCIKLGGYLRVETAFNTNSVYNGAYNSVAGAQNRFTNYFTARSREDLTIDTRTATEYGVVRTFFDATFSWTTGSYAGTGAGGSFYSAAAQAGGIGGVGNPSDGGIAGGSVGVYHAFIQFAGFTFGKTISPFDAIWSNYPGNNFDGLVGGAGTVTAQNQLTYTAQFGNGVSGTISLLDPTVYTQANIINASAGLITGPGFAGGSYGASAFGGTRAPDIVGVLKVDQAWGVAQLSVVGHNNHAVYNTGFEPTGHPDDKWGWAVQGALQIKNIPTGVGDTINVQAVYTDGATRYNFQSLVPLNYAMFSGTSLPGAYQSVGLAAAADTVYATGFQQDSVKTWGMRGAFNHNFDPYWSGAIYGAYAQLQYGSTGKFLICTGIAAIGAATAGITNCNPDFNIAQLGGIIRWTPVKNLTFSADVVWSRLDQKFAGTIAPVAGAASTGKPAAVYELKDQDTVQALLRVQRNF